MGPSIVFRHRIFDEVANELVLSSEYFPKYGIVFAWLKRFFDFYFLVKIKSGEIKDEVHVRICDLPIIDALRDLRQIHLNQ